MASLHRMTLAQLQKVSDFKVWTEFGSVEIIGETDVTGVDLADIITIAQGNVEVYDEERHKGSYP